MSDKPEFEPVRPATRKRGGPPPTPVVRDESPVAAPLAPDAVTVDTTAIRQRRLRTGERNRAKARSFRLVGQSEPMVVYIANLSDSGRHLELLEAGWEPVQPKELFGGLGDGMQNVNGHVRIGANGGEGLYKMPKALDDQIQKRKGEVTERAFMSEKKRRAMWNAALERDQRKSLDAGDRSDAEMVERAAGRLGDGEIYETEFRQVVDRVPIERD